MTEVKMLLYIVALILIKPTPITDTWTALSNLAGLLISITLILRAMYLFWLLIFVGDK